MCFFLCVLLFCVLLFNLCWLYLCVVVFVFLFLCCLFLFVLFGGAAFFVFSLKQRSIARAILVNAATLGWRDCARVAKRGMCVFYPAPAKVSLCSVL